jgi:hypothetical protein
MTNLVLIAVAAQPVKRAHGDAFALTTLSDMKTEECSNDGENRKHWTWPDYRPPLFA